MKKETEEKLACSLTAETTELLPFLPYLLQDLWELGSSPKEMVGLIEKHLPVSQETRILDLACGKGAVSINIAASLNVSVCGVDLMPEFIECANQKAKELKVDSLCRFLCGDANEAVNTERNYDGVIFGGAGNILGSPQETLSKLLKTVKPGGYLLMDEAYLPDGSGSEEIKFKYEYLTREQWMRLFEDNGLRLVEELPSTEGYDFDSDNKAIALRADELIAKHPEKRAIFEGYVRSQLNECEDLENNVAAVTWMLQRL
ncbi:MAG: class I SAM-dependent methyltransferase [Burkholderiales bacterium]|jgi:ubiquinone/menaquinone biosynthesis C-methylase UbiE|nr:class I SAM-dependent methyltransferase [Burkholderiales bacterium]